jgi:hypothetical protein
MTDVITFRPKRSKRELQHAFGNLSKKLNELIDRELADSGARDWRQVLQGLRPAVPDHAYEQCLTPE